MMIVNIADYLSQLKVVQDIFQDVMKELFTNKCSCDEAELHTFFIKWIKDSHIIYFDNKELSDNEVASGKYIDNSALIREYLEANFPERKYILKESETYREDGEKSRIVWVLFSECLDHNHGRMVLERVFEQLAYTFSHLPENICEGAKDVQHRRIAMLAQTVLNSAEGQIDLYLKNMFAPIDIYFINSLSGEYYEKAECESNMKLLPYALAAKLEPEDLIYNFQKIEFIPSNSRLIRKLLEITRKKGLYLILGESDCRDSFNILGICDESLLEKILTDENGREVPCISVNIKKHMQWDMFLGKTYMLTCKNGNYKIERSLQKEYMKTKLKAYFGEQEDGYDELTDSIILSVDQKHGTMLVIMDADNAHAETKRLGRLQYGLPETGPPRPPKGEEINCLNAIDGSVIMDTYGKVHGIGMILDGISKKEGSMARGARYNSAVKYCGLLRGGSGEGHLRELVKAMILVFSEDGSVDIVSV